MLGGLKQNTPAKLNVNLKRIAKISPDQGLKNFIFDNIQFNLATIFIKINTTASLLHITISLTDVRLNLYIRK